jgi:uncharacterized protein (DUF885 family)
MFSPLMLSISLFISANPTVSDESTVLVNKARALSFNAPQMSFETFLDDYQTRKGELQSWREIQSSSFDLLATSLSSSCEYRVANQINFIAKLALERDKLLGSQSKGRQYSGSFHSLERGKDLYKHWLKSWLLSDIDLGQLNKIAKQELIEVADKRRKLRDIQIHEGSEARIEGEEHQQIVERFRQKEAHVIANLDKYFPKLSPLKTVKIVPSTLPKSFPAPGIYDSVNERFIYHLQDEYFYTYTMDWLYLHEGNPGHHYQSQFAKQQTQCINLPDRFQTTAFSEGWAAYVETLGKSLGLYKDVASESYALDWQALRAVRVILDIGIHAYGWDDKKAKTIWMQHIPEQKSIMAREINRIRNWPGQVITYVYGKSVIERYINARMAGKDASLLDIHRDILVHSSYSLSLLERS